MYSTELQDSADIQQKIKAAGGGQKGECRVRRVGKILDVGVDGYYNTPSCVPDFVKVNIILSCTVPIILIPFSGS